MHIYLLFSTCTITNIGTDDLDHGSVFKHLLFVEMLDDMASHISPGLLLSLYWVDDQICTLWLHVEVCSQDYAMLTSANCDL